MADKSEPQPQCLYRSNSSHVLDWGHRSRNSSLFFIYNNWIFTYSYMRGIMQYWLLRTANVFPSIENAWHIKCRACLHCLSRRTLYAGMGENYHFVGQQEKKNNTEWRLTVTALTNDCRALLLGQINYLSLWLILLNSSFIRNGEKRGGEMVVHSGPAYKLWCWKAQTRIVHLVLTQALCENARMESGLHRATSLSSKPDHTYYYITSQRLSKPRLLARVIRNGLFVQIPP